MRSVRPTNALRVASLTEWPASRFHRTLVSFQASKTEERHRWCKYKEGFSADLVRYVLEKTGIDTERSWTPSREAEHAVHGQRAGCTRWESNYWTAARKSLRSGIYSGRCRPEAASPALKSVTREPPLAHIRRGGSVPAPADHRRCVSGGNRTAPWALSVGSRAVKRHGFPDGS